MKICIYVVILLKSHLYLCCDIVKESFVGNLKIPVLLCIKQKNNTFIGNVFKVIWLKVMRPTISSIRLYICDDEGKIISLP